MVNEPFFRREGANYAPTSSARGPWDPKSLHGRVVIALLGHAIEQTYLTPDYTPARLTVDMYRLPDLSPASVTTRVLRDSHRLKVIDSEFFSAGVSMARATCQLLRRTANPAGVVWAGPDWAAPAPETIAPPSERDSPMKGIWRTRPIVGAMGAHGPRRIWMSDIRDLVEGVPLTPFMRAALAADFASPFANAGDRGLGYINSDATLYLHRLPVGEWIGMEVTNHQATQGVAIGECLMHDVQGPIGSASVAALAQRQNARVGSPPAPGASK